LAERLLVSKSRVAEPAYRRQVHEYFDHRILDHRHGIDDHFGESIYIFLDGDLQKPFLS